MHPAVAVLGSVVALTLGMAMPLSVRAAGSDTDTANLIANLQPAVVNISAVTYDRTGFGAGNIAGEPTVSDHSAQSSGFFVSSSGLIVTNRHPISGASEITVTLSDSTKLKACVVSAAAQSDIALLKVNVGRSVPTVKFGDSDRISPGDPVFIIGNPLGLGNTVTAGIVSALDRDGGQSEFGSFFQIDASLNHGNSGGPVFNTAGDVIGVATALLSPGSETGSVGLGLAIPSNDAKLITNQLLQGRQPQLGWIGVHVQPVTTDIATAVKLPASSGSIITDVQDNSPATRAGLGGGDVILKINNDNEIAPRSLNNKIAGSAIGSVVELTVWQDGIQKLIPVVVEESPADTGMTKPKISAACGSARPTRSDLGLILGPLTEGARGKLGLGANEPGVLVADVVTNTAAADRGITAGSLILSVQRRPVASSADVQRAIDEARRENRSFVLVLVRNAQGRRWVALPLEP